MIRSLRVCVSANVHLTNFCCKSNLTTRPDFTKNNYDVQRGNYNVLQETHINFFTDLLGSQRVIMDLSDLERYNVDWFKQVRGNSSIVLKPKTTEEVSRILSFCNQQRLAVCPQGGNTCVVGASVPVFDEIIVSTDLMNKVISVDETSGTIVCQAGCILEVLNNYMAERGFIMPVDLGAKGSCHIGGNVATNAGGLRLLRYGNVHGNLLGLEVVKADGEILDCLNTLRKDNTGYHLKHLFVGSEGTLGFITKVAMQCPSKPKALSVAFLGAQNYDKILKTYRQAKQDLGEILSAVEVMDTPTMQLVNERLNLHSPIGDYPFYLLIETSGSNEEHDSEKLNNFLDYTLKKHFILNGTVTSERAKYEAIWSVRERAAEAFLLDGFVFCYDFSLPVQHFYTLMSQIKDYMGSKATRVFGFGHLGDGNLHAQISVPEYTKEMKQYIEPQIFELVKNFNGSISAEHGMGFLKAKYIDFANTAATVNLMKEMKIIMDPNGILNPYKVFTV